MFACKGQSSEGQTLLDGGLPGDPVKLALASDNKNYTSKHLLDHELPVHLQPLIDGVSTTLGHTEKHKLSSLLNEYQAVFMAPDGKLKRTTVAEHYINTGDAKPIRVPCRRIPMFKSPIIQKEIEKMLEQDVIEPSISPWNSPICLVTY